MGFINNAVALVVNGVGARGGPALGNLNQPNAIAGLKYGTYAYNQATG